MLVITNKEEEHIWRKRTILEDYWYQASILEEEYSMLNYDYLRKNPMDIPLTKLIKYTHKTEGVVSLLGYMRSFLSFQDFRKDQDLNFNHHLIYSNPILFLCERLLKLDKKLEFKFQHGVLCYEHSRSGGDLKDCLDRGKIYKHGFISIHHDNLVYDNTCISTYTIKDKDIYMLILKLQMKKWKYYP